MKKLLAVTITQVAMSICILAIAQQPITLEKLKEIAIVDQKVMMPMRDGIRLATDIYRLKGIYFRLLFQTRGIFKEAEIYSFHIYSLI